MDNLALITNTISKNADLWPMFFKQIDLHMSSDFCGKKYVFVDRESSIIPRDWESVIYDVVGTTYREQFTSAVRSVKEEYCIYVSEDYILYDDLREDIITEYKNFLDQHPNLSFIRLMKGGLSDQDTPYFPGSKTLHMMYTEYPYFYTNQAALWRTKDLAKIHEVGPNLHIGNQDWQNSFEYQATATCRDLDIQGLYCYHGEPKRGLYHYDTAVFPHVSTALVKGKWNISEYPIILTELIEKYNIDISARGSV
tara:strand:- start:554 stop:1312 length:759 start_codon:yes stop_codon:yes gene_type:complete